MSLIPWRRRKNNWLLDPFRELEELQRRVNDLFNIWQEKDDFLSPSFVPAVDVYEKNNNIIIKADLPVQFEGDRLIIRGEKKDEEEVKDKNSIRIERYYGSFERVIPIPYDIDEEGVKANYKKGVLEIILPKKGEDKSTGKKIDIEETD